MGNSDWSTTSQDYHRYLTATGQFSAADKRQQGERMHLAPLGYKNARDQDDRSILIRDRDTYALVQEARRLRKRGKSIRQICKIMKAKGLRSQRGKVIGPSSMVKILRLTD